MATILLSTVGAALGSSFGGTALGLSGAVIGRAIGATVGRSIDERILGSGSDPVISGRVDRFQLTGAGDGTPIPQVWGRMRVSGQVIWATRFLETANRNRGGKGAPRPSSVNYQYSISLAIALCRGEVLRIGRIWADGIPIAMNSLDIRIYSGNEDQFPDPKIEAVEGAGNAPSYRGTAYVVIEDLDLSRFGNRVPQLAFEVVRRAQGSEAEKISDLPASIQAVAMIPGTGEYALATTPVYFNSGPGLNAAANVHSAENETDFALSLVQLNEELPNCSAVSLVVSWFGNDLRCASCQIKPKVEQSTLDGIGMPWQVSGQVRATAATLPKIAGKPVYGGTPSDRSVIESIVALRGVGKEVMFYPFLLMDQLADNVLPDPWSDTIGQSSLPWRGRVTLSKAPGRLGSPDGTSASNAEISNFLGAALPEHFSQNNGSISYSGPVDWGLRRFILHYANLCALAGGVDVFCISSEMRGMTQIRGLANTFPFVSALRQLAAEVRIILGSSTKITYASDWSEYFGYHVDGDVYFHLDPLWADTSVDFVGIDNYMPLSDWRDGTSHADSGFGSIYNIEYLKSNILGGEGFDWYYDSPEGEAAQNRRPIVDSGYGEDWVFRYKDIPNWWGANHHNRIGGVRQTTATDWLPGMKPIRFTEYGCAAVDKGSNEPNKFLDSKSSESALPRASDGRRDDLIQMQYYRAIREFWSESTNNPASSIYSGRMLDLEHCHAWAWDARPFPEFPGNSSVWSDGENYLHGHWLNGRASSQPLAGVIAEICQEAGLLPFADVSGAHAIVRGFAVLDVGAARAALQPLGLAFGIDAKERDGLLQFYLRGAEPDAILDLSQLAVVPEIDGPLHSSRQAEAETTGRVRLTYIEADGNFNVRSSEATFPDESSPLVSQTEMALQLTDSEARAAVERWLTEVRVARDTVRFALPKSKLELGAGSVVSIDGATYRIDRFEQAEAQVIDAGRIDLGSYRPGSEIETAVPGRSSPAAPVPVFPIFLDLPLLTGDEAPQSPHIAIAASPWPGPVAVWGSASDAAYSLNTVIETPAIVGLTQTVLTKAPLGLWDRGLPLRVRLSSGELSSSPDAAILNGANIAAIGDGTAENWEVFQFAQATLVGPRTYDLTSRLRGQVGTDCIMPVAWPVGSFFVLLNASVSQINLATSVRALQRYYRIGVAELGYSDRNVTAESIAFNGIGYRPYAVSHLAALGTPGSSIDLVWIRRTRIDGDSWVASEVPLGEDSERYIVRIFHSGVLLRETEVFTSAWTYTTSMQASDVAGTAFQISVAQVSARFGAGPFTTLSLG